MKKELILQQMGWGHMPMYLVGQELKSEALVALTGKHLRGGKVNLVAARRREVPKGPVANRLWAFIADQAPKIAGAKGG